MSKKSFKKIAMAVVVRNSKIMVQHRFRPNIGFIYEFPGGSVDANETPEVAAIRELVEETGLVATKTLTSFPYENEFNGTINFVLLEINHQAQPKITNEARQQTFYWFEPNEIPLCDFHKSDVTFIKTDLLKWIKRASK